jgi:hypothetical protein
MNDVVAIMTGATSPEAAGYERVVQGAEPRDAGGPRAACTGFHDQAL